MINNYDVNNKLTVFPRVTVYQNLLQDVDKVLKIVKKSESNKNNKYMFNNWTSWRANWDGMSMHTEKDITDFTPSKDQEYLDQEFLHSRLSEAYSFAYKDYFKDYPENSGVWPDIIKDWNFENNMRWTKSGITFLKYFQDNEELKKHDPENGLYHLSMNYHTDTNHQNLDARDSKLIITITFYLNDDYDGGEISFYNGTDNKVYNYKPKAGDITVFPSFEPYYHGVLPFSKNDRYLIRMFFMYNFEGTKDWLANEEKYGKELWFEMEEDRLSKEFYKGSNLIRVVMPNYVSDNSDYKEVQVNDDFIEVK